MMEDLQALFEAEKTEDLEKIFMVRIGGVE